MVKKLISLIQIILFEISVYNIKMVLFVCIYTRNLYYFNFLFLSFKVKNKAFKLKIDN